MNESCVFGVDDDLRVAEEESGNCSLDIVYGDVSGRDKKLKLGREKWANVLSFLDFVCLLE